MSNQTATASTSTDTLALLTFTVGGQTYSLPVTSVVRIIEMVTITRLPGVPDTIQGIINLQGKAVPVVDLRLRLGLSWQAYGLHTPIILTEMNGDGQVLGLIVDTVEDVLNAPHKSLEMTKSVVPAELMGQMAIQAARGSVAGVAKVERQMILVLNVHALLTPTEQIQLSETLATEN
jgi:purine-binding chemotaxis protein CheW